MVIQCSHCQARFKLADDKIKAEGTKVRCNKCREIFTVFPQVDEPPAAGSTAPEPVPTEPRAAAAGSEEFSFDSGAVAPPPSETQHSGAPAAAEAFDSSSAAPTFAASIDLPGEELPSFGFDSFDADGDAFSLDENEQHAPCPPLPDLNDQAFAFDFAAESGQPEFSLDLDTSPPPVEQGAPAAAELPGDAFDFDNAASGPAPALEVSFADEPATATGTEFGELSFDEPPAAAPAFAAPDDNFSFDVPEPGGIELPTSPPPSDAAQDSAPPAEDAFDFSNISFGTEEATPPPPPPARGQQGGAALDNPFDFGDDNPFGEPEPPAPAAAPIPAAPPRAAPPPPPPPEEPAIEKKPATPSVQVAKQPDFTPRHRAATRFSPASLIKPAVVLLLVAAAGYGYLNYDKLLLGFQNVVGRYIDKQAPAESQGVIELANLSYSTVTNSVEGDLVVIRGEAANRYNSLRSSIRIKAILYGAKGAILKEQIAYCGNVLNDEILAKASFAEIGAAMANELGDSLTNMNIQPGKAIPFTIVFKGVPKDLAEFAVEVVDSKPGA